MISTGIAPFSPPGTSDYAEAGVSFRLAFPVDPVGVVEMRSIDIWRVRDGVFVEHWDELNLMQVFQQIGALPPLGGPRAEAQTQA